MTTMPTPITDAAAKEFARILVEHGTPDNPKLRVTEIVPAEEMRKLERENAEYLSIIHWKAADNLKLHDLICDLWRENAQLKAAQNIAQEPVAQIVEQPEALPFKKVAWLGKDLPIGAQLYVNPQPSVDATLENARIAEAVRQACLDEVMSVWNPDEFNATTWNNALRKAVQRVKNLDLTTILKDK